MGKDGREAGQWSGGAYLGVQAEPAMTWVVSRRSLVKGADLYD